MILVTFRIKSVAMAVKIALNLIFGLMFDVEKRSANRRKKAEPATQDGAIWIVVWLNVIISFDNAVGVKSFMARFAAWIVRGVRAL